MKSKFEQDRSGRDNTTAAVVATFYVLGLASLLFLNRGTDGNNGAMKEPPLAYFSMSSSEATPPPSATTSFLHAPISDPSLPSLEAMLSRKDLAPADEAPAPTF